MKLTTCFVFLYRELFLWLLKAIYNQISSLFVWICQPSLFDMKYPKFYRSRYHPVLIPSIVCGHLGGMMVSIGLISLITTGFVINRVEKWRKIRHLYSHEENSSLQVYESFARIGMVVSWLVIVSGIGVLIVAFFKYRNSEILRELVDKIADRNCICKKEKRKTEITKN